MINVNVNVEHLCILGGLVCALWVGLSLIICVGLCMAASNADDGMGAP